MQLISDQLKNSTDPIEHLKEPSLASHHCMPRERASRRAEVWRRSELAAQGGCSSERVIVWFGPVL